MAAVEGAGARDSLDRKVNRVREEVRTAMRIGDIETALRELGISFVAATFDLAVPEEMNPEIARQFAAVLAWLRNAAEAVRIWPTQPTTERFIAASVGRIETFRKKARRLLDLLGAPLFVDSEFEHSVYRPAALVEGLDEGIDSLHDFCALFTGPDFTHVRHTAVDAERVPYATCRVLLALLRLEPNELGFNVRQIAFYCSSLAEQCLAQYAKDETMAPTAEMNTQCVFYLERLVAIEAEMKRQLLVAQKKEPLTKNAAKKHMPASKTVQCVRVVGGLRSIRLGMKFE